MQVEMCSMQVSERGDGFVMDLANERRDAIRLEFPDWILHQLMRALPRIDAALQGAGAGSDTLIAYPLLQWSVESAGAGQGVALHLRNDRHVDAAFQLELEKAVALHRQLGEAIAGAARRSAAGSD